MSNPREVAAKAIADVARVPFVGPKQKRYAHAAVDALWDGAISRVMQVNGRLSRDEAEQIVVALLGDWIVEEEK